MDKLCWKMAKSWTHNRSFLLNKCQHPHSPLQCWKIIKCKLALDQSVLSTSQRGGEGQNTKKKEISNPCDQGCSFKVGKTRLLQLFNTEHRSKLSSDYSSGEWWYEIVEVQFAEMTGAVATKQAGVTTLHVSVVWTFLQKYSFSS